MFTLLVFYLTGKVAVLRARTTTHVIVCVPKYTTAVTPSRVSDCRGEKEEERNFFFVRSSPLPFFLKNRLLLLLCNGVYNFNPFYIYILHLYLFDIRRTKKCATPFLVWRASSSYSVAAAAGCLFTDGERGEKSKRSNNNNNGWLLSCNFS